MASAGSSSTKKGVVLRSSDGVELEVEETVAMISKTIKQLIEGCSTGDPIPVPNVSSKNLALVMEYCKRVVDYASVRAAANDDPHDKARRIKEFEEESRAWFKSFFELHSADVFDLVVAAKDLEAKGLQKLASRILTYKIKGKTAVEIQEMFNIKNVFTPDEEEANQREIQ